MAAWMRQIHLYLALFVSPFLVVFAISVILLNHGLCYSPRDREMTGRRTASITFPAGLDGVDLAKDIMRQVGVAGEIDHLPRHLSAGRFTIPISRPGRKIELEVNRAAKTVAIAESRLGLSETINYLHKSPGPHNAHIRVNWQLMRLWTLLADGTVYFILLISATGIYLWAIIRSERKSGLLALGGGCACFIAILLALTH